MVPDSRDDLCPMALEAIMASAPAMSVIPMGQHEESWEDCGALTRRAVGSPFHVPPGGSPL
jgi:hypothetical protein